MQFCGQGGRSMKKGIGIGKEALRIISEKLTEVKVQEGEWEEILVRVDELLNNIKALDELELSEVGPAFSYNVRGEAE
jgi:hypothetical protein